MDNGGWSCDMTSIWSCDPQGERHIFFQPKHESWLPQKYWRHSRFGFNRPAPVAWPGSSRTSKPWLYWNQFNLLLPPCTCFFSLLMSLYSPCCRSSICMSNTDHVSTLKVNATPRRSKATLISKHLLAWEVWVNQGRREEKSWYFHWQKGPCPFSEGDRFLFELWICRGTDCLLIWKAACFLD